MNIDLSNLPIENGEYITTTDYLEFERLKKEGWSYMSTSKLEDGSPLYLLVKWSKTEDN